MPRIRRKRILILLPIITGLIVVFNQTLVPDTLKNIFNPSMITEGDELPAAVLGTAPAPRGKLVNYFEEAQFLRHQIRPRSNRYKADQPASICIRLERGPDLRFPY